MTPRLVHFFCTAACRWISAFARPRIFRAAERPPHTLPSSSPHEKESGRLPLHLLSQESPSRADTDNGTNGAGNTAGLKTLTSRKKESIQQPLIIPLIHVEPHLCESDRCTTRFINVRWLIRRKHLHRPAQVCLHGFRRRRPTQTGIRTYLDGLAIT